VESKGGRFRALRPVDQAGKVVRVAVAAQNGLVPGPLSQNFPVVNTGALDAEIVAFDLPAVAAGAINTRRDFTGSVTFRNKGPIAWIGRIDQGDGSLTTIGVYMQVQLAKGGGLATVFVPLLKDNLDATQPEIVQPGQTVKINMNKMQVDSAFASSNGQLTKLLMPYTRAPLTFNLGMGTLTTTATQANYGHFGTVYTALGGKPLGFSISKPKRIARQLAIISQTVAANQSLVAGLSTGKDFKVPLVSVRGTATAGAILHPKRRLEYLKPNPQATASGVPGTVFRIANPSSAAMQLIVSAVELHPMDLYFAGTYATPLFRGDDVSPGSARTYSLSRFDSRFHVTAATSDTVIDGGKGIDWSTELLGNPSVQSLEITSEAPATVHVNTGTVEIWEDVPASTPPQEPPRQMVVRATFAVGSPPPGYVSLVTMNNCESADRYYIAYLKYLSGVGNARCAFVLRANGANVLEPWIEISASGVTSPLTVELHVLEECVDTSTFP